MLSITGGRCPLPTAFKFSWKVICPSSARAAEPQVWAQAAALEAAATVTVTVLSLAESSANQDIAIKIAILKNITIY